MSDTRLLPFPLYNSASVEAITDADVSVISLPAFPIDPDEKTFVLLHVSANEYKRIASSIDIGSDIGYPNDSVGVWYDWVRATMSDTPCEIITDCIDNNEGTRNSIVNLVTNPTTVEKIIEKAKELGLIPVEPTVPVTNCNDNIYGACVQYVAQINQSLSDFFEVSETFRGEQIFEVIAALDLPVGAPVGFVSFMRDQAKDGYDASYTEVIADQIACDLFCMFKDTCQFSLQMAYDYHVDKISDFIDLSPFGDGTALNLLAAYLGFDDIAADIWVNGLMALFVGQLLYFEQEQNQFGGSRGTISQFQQRLQSWMNDPDPDWSFLCTECPDEPQKFINTNTSTAVINGVTVNGIAEGVGNRYDVEVGDTIELSISGQLGIRFNTSQSNIFDPADPLMDITITANGGGMIIYNRSANIGTTNGTYNAGFINADNTISFEVN